MLKEVGHGVVGALYASTVLAVAMVAAVAIGVGLVHLLVEEPIVVREKLQFDYTDPNPVAVFELNTGGGAVSSSSSSFCVGHQNHHQVGKPKQTKVISSVPIGYTYTVSVALWVPESYYNMQIGVFQLTAEVLSTDGAVLARSSTPCMLHYRSRLIRLSRTLVLAFPILVGLAQESQRLTVPLIRYTEPTVPRTGSIRVVLSPRAGTLNLPDLYEAEIAVRSELPRRKAVVRDWKWTLCVWTTLCVFAASLGVLGWCFGGILFPTKSIGIGEWRGVGGGGGRLAVEEEMRGRRWREVCRRRKRKADDDDDDEYYPSASSSYAVTREEAPATSSAAASTTTTATHNWEADAQEEEYQQQQQQEEHHDDNVLLGVGSSLVL